MDSLHQFHDLCSLLFPEAIELDTKDLRWVGAWWLGFLVASCVLFLTALPYLFFPRNMPKEVSQSYLIQKSCFVIEVTCPENVHGHSQHPLWALISQSTLFVTFNPAPVNG